jgi:hypothetical protein
MRLFGDVDPTEKSDDAHEVLVQKLLPAKAAIDLPLALAIVGLGGHAKLM